MLKYGCFDTKSQKKHNLIIKKLLCMWYEDGSKMIW